MWLNIPALFLTTLLFRGQAARRERLGDQRPALASDVLRALPMVGGLFLITWIGFAQDSSLAYVASSPDHPTAVGLALRVGGAYARPGTAGHSGLGLASPPPMLLLLLVGLAAIQVLYLDRLVITAGPTDQATQSSRSQPHASAGGWRQAPPVPAQAWQAQPPAPAGAWPAQPPAPTVEPPVWPSAVVPPTGHGPQTPAPDAAQQHVAPERSGSPWSTPPGQQP